MTMKIGLVLAGGGAKGVYQSGVVKYLAPLSAPNDCRNKHWGAQWCHPCLSCTIQTRR